MHRFEERKKISVFCDSLPVEQAHIECCITDRSRNTVGFVKHVVPNTTKHDFVSVVGE